MEKISELFGFLIILKESIKILPKNGKFMASIAILSLLIPSILVSLFSYLSRSLISDMTASYTKPSSGPDSGFSLSRMLIYWALILAVEIVFLLIYYITSHLFGIATILVSATSYTGKSLTTEDLFSSIKKKWRSPFSNGFRASSRRSSPHYLTVAIMLAVSLAVFYRNFITIAIAIIVGIPVSVLQLHSSVIWVLSVVVSVIEDSSRIEALEKAEKLVKEGQHLHGFMFSLFINLLSIIILLAFWMMLSDNLSLDLTIYGLFYFNFFSLLMMSIFVAYTVFYFQCKKHHGEEIDVIGVGDHQYTQLPTTLGTDIP